MDFNTFNVLLNIFKCAFWQFEHHKVFSISFIYFQGKAGISTAEGVQIAHKKHYRSEESYICFYLLSIYIYIYILIKISNEKESWQHGEVKKQHSPIKSVEIINKQRSYT